MHRYESIASDGEICHIFWTDPNQGTTAVYDSGCGIKKKAVCHVSCGK